MTREQMLEEKVDLIADADRLRHYRPQAARLLDEKAAVLERRIAEEEFAAGNEQWVIPAISSASCYMLAGNYQEARDVCRFILDRQPKPRIVEEVARLIADIDNRELLVQQASRSVLAIPVEDAAVIGEQCARLEEQLLPTPFNPMLDLVGCV